MHRDRWTRPVIAAATEVHRVLGAGLLESVYRLALVEELRNRGIPFEQNKTVPIRYRSLVLVTGLEIALLVAGQLIVETLSADRIINFNVAHLSRGIRRIFLPTR